MFQQIVLHDGIVAMRINPDVCIMSEAEVYHVAEDMMSVWIAGNTMDNMIRQFIVQPFAIVYLMVSGFG